VGARAGRKRNAGDEDHLHEEEIGQLNYGSLVLLLLSLATPPVHADDDRASPAQKRPRIGVAFGGGSARGLAHIGIVRWFEEHRIPIDLIAGTSMGGLVGGAIASGMSSSELTAILNQVDWDEMFGASPFRYKNIRRKDDARAYPSRIEFGFRRGIALPIALNNGQQVDFLLARIAGPYGSVASFDELPTPFRALACDLVAAQLVVLDSGSLTSAMRATMSLPGVFPPVERDGKVLVDGGALNNVPADVVRAMGADVVIAIHVGYMGDTRVVNRSITGLMGQTVDIMMQSGTRTAMKAADIVINPHLERFASLDYRRSAELEAEGYKAAEAMTDRLLPLALSEAEWTSYLEARRARRKNTWPAPQFVSVVGAVPSDQQRIEKALAALVGPQPLEVAALETRLESFAGMDRYDTIGWQYEQKDGRTGIRVEARPKVHAPPFLMLGFSLQNTTTDEFEFQMAARYLTFDTLGSGSELRVDGAFGVQPGIGFEIYRPIGHSPMFVTAGAIASREVFNFTSEDVVVARYQKKRATAAVNVGVNLGRDSDVRLGVAIGQLKASVETGDPGLPELSGRESRARLAWRYDGQDSVVVPSSGARLAARLDYILQAPAAPSDVVTDRSNDGVRQVEGGGSIFWTVQQRSRLFMVGGLGATSGRPLPTEQFQLGLPFRLGAYGTGEFRGDHYGVLTVGYLRPTRRLPDFLGGSVYVGGWLENGAAFDAFDDAKLRTNVSAGVVADTLVGPVIVGSSFAFNGDWRYYIGLGRLF
jgi:NTE family protein